MDLRGRVGQREHDRRGAHRVDQRRVDGATGDADEHVGAAHRGGERAGDAARVGGRGQLGLRPACMPVRPVCSTPCRYRRARCPAHPPRAGSARRPRRPRRRRRSPPAGRSSPGRSPTRRSSARRAPPRRCRAGRRASPGCRAAPTSRRSTSKHRGAEMSSRLTAPNECAIAATVATISSGSVVSSTIGTESSPANAFISADLPSITGSAAFAPMSPRPEHGGAVADHGDHPGRPGVRHGGHRVLGDQAGHAGDPGRVEHRQVAPVAQRAASARRSACRRDARRARRRR